MRVNSKSSFTFHKDGIINHQKLQNLLQYSKLNLYILSIHIVGSSLSAGLLRDSLGRSRRVCKVSLVDFHVHGSVERHIQTAPSLACKWLMGGRGYADCESMIFSFLRSMSSLRFRSRTNRIIIYYLHEIDLPTTCSGSDRFGEVLGKIVKCGSRPRGQKFKACVRRSTFPMERIA